MSEEPWDTKLENGMNVTETRLFKALKRLNLNPVPQYKIDRMTVDFAFLDKKLVVEVNGEYHKSKKQKVTDAKRYYALKNQGWEVKSFRAETVYDNAGGVAYIIRKELNKLTVKMPKQNYKKVKKEAKVSGIKVKRTETKSENSHKDYKKLADTSLIIAIILIFIPFDAFILSIVFGIMAYQYYKKAKEFQNE